MPHFAILALLSLLGTLLVAALVILAVRLRRLRALQAEAVRQAAAEAREQFGRDVHDLVSSRLWLATLRSELAYRLADDDSPLRPALADVVQSIRQASADIRNVTRSFRDVSLPSELANARAVLRAYGTDCKIEVTDAELGDEVSAVLAIMVREAVTNVLRHSRATLCAIEIAVRGDTATLTVTNDGVDPALPRGDGNGLANLRNRAAALNGVVGTVLDPHGWFRLIAEIPCKGGDHRRP